MTFQRRQPLLQIPTDVYDGQTIGRNGLRDLRADAEIQPGSTVLRKRAGPSRAIPCQLKSSRREPAGNHVVGMFGELVGAKRDDDLWPQPTDGLDQPPGDFPRVAVRQPAIRVIPEFQVSAEDLRRTRDLPCANLRRPARLSAGEANQRHMYTLGGVPGQGARRPTGLVVGMREHSQQGPFSLFLRRSHP